MKFWDRKSKIRRYLSFENRTILVIEQLSEKSGKDISTVIDKIIQESPIFINMIKELESDYPDINFKI